MNALEVAGAVELGFVNLTTGLYDLEDNFIFIVSIEQARNISDRATRDIHTYTGNTNFQASSVTVITWDSASLHLKPVNQ